jgi:hypothetical protein
MAEVNIDQMTETQLEEYFRNTLVGYDLATMRNVLAVLRKIFLGDMDKVREFLSTAGESINNTELLVQKALEYADETRVIASEANNKSDFTQKQLDQVAGASTIDPAVAQMKVGEDGTVYDSPAQRLLVEGEEKNTRIDNLSVFKLIADIPGTEFKTDQSIDYGYVRTQQEKLLGTFHQKMSRTNGFVIECQGDSMVNGQDTTSSNKRPVSEDLTHISGDPKSTQTIAGTTYPEALQEYLQSVYG